MSLQGTIEIDGKQQAVKADEVRISLGTTTDSQRSAEGSTEPTTVKETIAIKDGVLTTTVTVKQGGTTTTTTTTTTEK